MATVGEEEGGTMGALGFFQSSVVVVATTEFRPNPSVSWRGGGWWPGVRGVGEGEDARRRRTAGGRRRIVACRQEEENRLASNLHLICTSISY